MKNKHNLAIYQAQQILIWSVNNPLWDQQAQIKLIEH